MFLDFQNFNAAQYVSKAWTLHFGPVPLIYAPMNRELVNPVLKHMKEIGYEDILTHVHENEEYLNRYNTLVAQRELERQPNFVWCTNPWCGQGQIHDGGATVPLVTCDSCHERTCFVHRIPWHNNLTCDQYSKHEENKASEEYIRIYMKRCPNTECKRPVEKIAGCDHMTCHRPGGCGHQLYACFPPFPNFVIAKPSNQLLERAAGAHGYSQQRTTEQTNMSRLYSSVYMELQ
ncbi:unnamed protein product [Rhizoctonia solani]|uniref:RBR-type E3 ubiquitin transferase n=1 Tax=Rhizoctonia solani TaxID=456999 RepID=A0A8H3BQB7_9AGAM|nr:unnamed protein product [Rhizoctonia solani]